MGKLHIPLNEAGLWNHGVRLDDALAKKGELVSELKALLRANVAGEIPPFRLETRVTRVIFREFVLPSRQGRLPFSLSERGACQQDE